jgi:hypothetical protein
MSSPLTLPQNGLRVGEQIVAEGDSVSLGNNVGVKNNLSVGGTLYANKVSSPFVTKTHTSNSDNLIIDCNYTQHAITLTASPTGISFINVPEARDGNYTVSVYLQQDVVGGRNISWASNTNFLWPNVGYVANNPVYPILQTNPYRLDVFKFITFNGGQTWIAYQENPVAPQNADLVSLQYASSAYNNIPGYVPNAAPYSGSIVQVKQVTTTANIDYGTGGQYLDLMAMTFYPKYRGSQLLLSSELKEGTSTTSFATHHIFTQGTTPIQGGSQTGSSIWPTSGVFANDNNAQKTHFGGYVQATDSNHLEYRQGSINFAHNSAPGGALDLRIRARQADYWSAQRAILNVSWGAPNGSYTAYNVSSFTVMEYLP